MKNREITIGDTLVQPGTRAAVACAKASALAR